MIALTYDDITLIPNFSEVESRSNVNLQARLSRQHTVLLPIVASPMDTVCDGNMATAMMKLGAVGCIHRFMTIEEQTRHVKQVLTEASKKSFEWGPRENMYIPIMAAVGANGDYMERAQELVTMGADVILIDVAHGHHKFVKDALSALKASLPSSVDVIAGNVATPEGAVALCDWGADGVRVGVGGGSLCTTRIRTGFGMPNVTSLMMIVEALDTNKHDIPVIADGGIRTSGDIAKALALGANTVMLGSLLAGTQESPGKILETATGALFKRYRGAASLETKSIHGQAERHVEGESTVVPFKGGVKYVVESLMDGLRSACSYAGAETLDEFAPEIVQVTASGLHEARPHLLK